MMLRLYAKEWVDFMFPAECVITGKKTKEGWFYITPFRVVFEEGWNGVIWSVDNKELKSFEGGRKKNFLKMGWSEYTDVGMYDYNIIVRPKKYQGWLASPAFVARLIQFWADTDEDGNLVRGTMDLGDEFENVMDFEWNTVQDLFVGLDADPKRGFLKCDWHALREYGGPDDEDVKNGKIKFDKSDGSTPESQHYFATNAILATLNLTNHKGFRTLAETNWLKESLYLKTQQDIVVSKMRMSHNWMQARGFQEIGAHPDAPVTIGNNKQTPSEFCAEFGKRQSTSINAPVNTHPAHAYVWSKKQIEGFKKILKQMDEEWDSAVFEINPIKRVNEITVAYMNRLMNGKEIDGYVPKTTIRNIVKQVSQEITQYRKKCSVKFPVWALSDIKTS